MSICGNLMTNIARSCATPLQAGTEDRSYIINKADILSIVKTGDVITDIVLASGKSAYFIDGTKNSIEPMSAMVTAGFENMFDHTITYKGFDISPEVRTELNNGKDGKYVAIVENYFKGTAGNSAFEVYGESTGLEFSEISRNANDEATQGAFHFVLTTVRNKEPKLPSTLYDTSYAVTKAIVEGLL